MSQENPFTRESLWRRKLQTIDLYGILLKLTDKLRLHDCLRKFFKDLKIMCF